MAMSLTDLLITTACLFTALLVSYRTMKAYESNQAVIPASIKHPRSHKRV